MRGAVTIYMIVTVHRLLFRIFRNRDIASGSAFGGRLSAVFHIAADGVGRLPDILQKRDIHTLQSGDMGAAAGAVQYRGLSRQQARAFAGQDAVLQLCRNGHGDGAVRLPRHKLSVVRGGQSDGGTQEIGDDGSDDRSRRREL